MFDAQKKVSYFTPVQVLMFDTMLRSNNPKEEICPSRDSQKYKQEKYFKKCMLFVYCIECEKDILDFVKRWSSPRGVVVMLFFYLR